MGESLVGRTGFSLILLERNRQIIEEGYSFKNDDQYIEGELAMAAVCYALPQDSPYLKSEESCPDLWPFDARLWKPGKNGVHGRIRALAKAGALIAAEIDRLGRLSYRTGGIEGESE